MVKGLKDTIIDIIIIIILLMVGLITIIPILVVVSISLTPYSEIMKNGGFVLIPKIVTFAAYNEILLKSNIGDAFLLTTFTTIAGTLLNLILTILMAYPLSRKNLPGRSVFIVFIVFTMLFSGGIIPTYLVVKNIGLINTLGALIIPSAISTFNILIMKSFFENLPIEMFEAAKIDGASEFYILPKIVFPLSIPVILTVGLFYMVSNWNVFMSAILYISDPKIQPLQVVVRNIILSSTQGINNVDQTVPTESLKMAAVVIASAVPIVVYPFIQKYFTKGILIGAVKG